MSWLYNLDAYKRLFPSAYRRSVREPGFAPHLNGTSTWGQVLDWRQQVKPAMRDAVLANLACLDVRARRGRCFRCGPWRRVARSGISMTGWPASGSGAARSWQGRALNPATGAGVAFLHPAQRHLGLAGLVTRSASTTSENAGDGCRRLGWYR
jgi:hypothetical protein